MRSEGGVQLENMLNQRMGAKVVEDSCITLGPKLIECTSAKHMVQEEFRGMEDGWTRWVHATGKPTETRRG